MNGYGAPPPAPAGMPPPPAHMPPPPPAYYQQQGMPGSGPQQGSAPPPWAQQPGQMPMQPSYPGQPPDCVICHLLYASVRSRAEDNRIHCRGHPDGTALLLVLHAARSWISIMGLAWLVQEGQRPGSNKRRRGASQARHLACGRPWATACPRRTACPRGQALRDRRQAGGHRPTCLRPRGPSDTDKHMLLRALWV